EDWWSKKRAAGGFARQVRSLGRIRSTQAAGGRAESKSSFLFVLGWVNNRCGNKGVVLGDPAKKNRGNEPLDARAFCLAGEARSPFEANGECAGHKQC